MQCYPCRGCYQQDAPFFYPKLSTTYEDLDYETEFCQHLKNKKRGFFGLCNYTYSYKDGSYSSGILSKETLYLDSTRDEKNDFHKFVFGCGHGNNGRFSSRTQGVVGLGGGPLSLTSQLKTQIEHKFSYCLVPVEAQTTSKLIFGPRAEISGEGVVSTPLVSTCEPTFYCIVLESISIGTERMTIGQSHRRIIGPSQHHIMVDSGTTFTLLHSTVYDKLEAMVKKTIGNSTNPVPDPTKLFRLCYEKHSVAGVKIPNMVFHFTGADLHLPLKNTFANYNNMYCMMILPTPDRLSILGSMSQVNFLVEYDLLHRKISFVPANCNSLG
ncbi:aspartic proteinase CDR1-like [Tripterygium wilfordii]|uniref:aspartic proteinase CDR1-like n=1 Tax=Tripterygium wilfordii TaxID=458696 RepID=UPI0018F81FB6|nr:aspartic proteinase CDR1-like [Tripterygium wilfordii]